MLMDIKHLLDALHKDDKEMAAWVEQSKAEVRCLLVSEARGAAAWAAAGPYAYIIMGLALH